MKRMGWCKGHRLGREERSGLETALEGDGQKPTDKTGLGFRGPRLVRRQLTAPYAVPSPSGAIGKTPPAENLYRRNDPRDVVKYRTANAIAFVAGDVMKPKWSYCVKSFVLFWQILNFYPEIQCKFCNISFFILFWFKYIIVFYFTNYSIQRWKEIF